MFNITPSLGADLDYVGDKPYYDANFGTPSPALGTKMVGNDGHTYVFVRASAAIAASTAVIITEPGFTAAAGAGAYATRAAVANGNYFWARSNAL